MNTKININNGFDTESDHPLQLYSAIIKLQQIPY